jgi:hypothetical protein
MSADDKTVDLLRKHFPKAASAEVARAAYELEIDHSIARGMQKVDRADKNPQADIKRLSDTVGALKKAEDKLQEVGLFGGGLLIESAQELDRLDADLFGSHGPGSLRAIQIFSDAVVEIREKIEEALKASAGRDEQKTRMGTPPKVEAKQVALALYSVFEDLTGIRPKVPTNRETEAKYGPFLDFVRDAFDHFEIKASVENMAREACGAKSQQKK